MGRKFAVCFVFILAACSPAADEPVAETSTSTSAAGTVTTTSPPPTTDTTTTSDPPPTTTPTLIASAPTTTLPDLDRSPEATTARLTEDLGVLLANGPRVAGSSAERSASEHAAESLGEVGTVTIDYIALPNGLQTRNVRSNFGSGEPHLLLGAHIDSVPGSPGADDNASGVLVLLELARRLADDPPPLTITVVAFGAEERLSGYSRNAHHYGSRALASRLEAAGSLPDRMISVDMVGVDDRLLSVVYRGTDRSTAAMLAAVGHGAGAPISVEERGDISDHEAFARRGVPSAFLWRPNNPDYHRPGDDAVDVDHLLENLEVLEAFIAAMADPES